MADEDYAKALFKETIHSGFHIASTSPSYPCEERRNSHESQNETQKFVLQAYDAQASLFQEQRYYHECVLLLFQIDSLLFYIIIDINKKVR